MSKEEPDMLSPNQAAKLLNVHPETIRRLCREGVLTHWKVGQRFRIKKYHLMMYADSVKVEGKY